MTALHSKAQQHDGAVYSLMGNHELLNVMGDMTYVSHENIKEFTNYRTKNNSTCLHCPEGFSSNEGSNLCVKGNKETLINTKFCPKGTIVGNNPYATYGNSCLKCNVENKEYMPNMIEDACIFHLSFQFQMN